MSTSQAGSAENATRLLFVTGAIKTATSSVLAALNAHPDVLLLYEAQLFADPPTRRGAEFLAAYPEARPYFRPATDYATLYEEFAEWLAGSGHVYSIVGDKIPSLSVEVLVRLGARPVIYCVRDVRTWVAKTRGPRGYVVDADVVPAAVQYCVHFLESLKLERRLHVATERFVEDNVAVVAEITRFAGLDRHAATSTWWKGVGATGQTDPKSAIRWWDGSHFSSRVEPDQRDTVVRLRSHPFWGELLPVFDRYYTALNTEIGAGRLDDDIRFIESLRHRGPVSLDDAYERIAVTPVGRPRRPSTARMLSRVGRRVIPGRPAPRL
ncbi:MAG: hypothetical protein ACRD29_19635 [Acidimicrobiales bacterium]